MLTLNLWSHFLFPSFQFEGLRLQGRDFLALLIMVHFQFADLGHCSVEFGGQRFLISVGLHSFRVSKELIRGVTVRRSPLRSPYRACDFLHHLFVLLWVRVGNWRNSTGDRIFDRFCMFRMASTSSHWGMNGSGEEFTHIWYPVFFSWSRLILCRYRIRSLRAMVGFWLNIVWMLPGLLVLLFGP